MRKRFLSLITAVVLACLLAVGPPGTAAAADAGVPLSVRVAGAAGVPLSGARIEVIAPGRGQVVVTESDSGGAANLRVPTGTVYWVRVWARGHTTAERPWVPQADGRAVTLNLAPLLGEVSGQVVDHLGWPVSGATVTAWLPGFGETATASTGPDGTYTLRGLRVGEHLLQVEARGFQPLVQPATVQAGRTAPADLSLTPAGATVAGTVVDARSALPVAGARAELLQTGWGVVAAAATGQDGRFALDIRPVAAGEFTLHVTAAGYTVSTTAPFRLEAGGRREFSGNARVELAPLFGAVWGFVLADDESPEAGARVELQMQAAGTVATTTTDADGFFALDAVRPGTYRIRTFPGDGWAPSESDWLVVAAGEEHALRIRPVSYAEQDFGDGIIAGVVSDGGARPVTGATVTLLRGDETVATATTDDRGRYRFTAVAGNVGTMRGRPAAFTGYIVRVTAPGYLPTDQPAGGPSGELTVRDNGLTQADFHLRPSDASLAGRVLDDRNQPLPGSAVRLYREGTPEPIAQTATDADGGYRFGNLSTVGGVRYYVAAAAGGYAAAVTQPQRLDTAPAGATEVNLNLPPVTAVLQGRVTDAHGRPVPGAAVTVLRAADGRTWEATASDHGWFELDGLPATAGDHYLVRAAVKGVRPGTAGTAHNLAGRRSVTVQVPLAPPGAVGGVVYGPGGAPVPGAGVELWQEGEARPVAQTTTDARGRYQFDALPPGGRYTVSAASPGYLPSAQAPGALTVTPLLTIAAGETTGRDIGLVTAGAVNAEGGRP